MRNKDFIDEHIDWLSKNPMKVNKFGGKAHLWYVTMPDKSMKTFTHEEYEYYLSCVNQKLRP